jgi:hypothetical protein
MADSPTHSHSALLAEATDNYTVVEDLKNLLKAVDPKRPYPFLSTTEGS